MNPTGETICLGAAANILEEVFHEQYNLFILFF